MDFQELSIKGYTCDKITPENFDKLLKKYENVVPAKLEELEKQRLKVIPKALLGRDSPYLTKAELQTLMEWKLNHGTFRPSLRKLVASNSEDAVESCTREAFDQYDNDEDWSKAITNLAKGLRGVGPATASLLLNTHDNKKVPFFSDELFRWAMFAEGRGQGWDRRIKYSMGEYKDMYGKMERTRVRLGDGDREMTSTEMEMVAYVLGRMTDDIESDKEESKDNKIEKQEGENDQEEKSGEDRKKRKRDAEQTTGRRKRTKD